MQSSNTVLSFYFDMLFTNSIQTVKKSFIGNSTLKANGYTYIESLGYYHRDIIIEDNDSVPKFAMDILYKEDFFGYLLKLENISIYKTIENEVYSEEKDSKKYLQGVFDEIQILLKQVIKFDCNEAEFTKSKLIEMIDNLKTRYSLEIEYHNVYTYLTEEKYSAFFKDKDLKRSFYEDLYEISYKLNLIDDIETQEEDFISSFTSPNPQTLEKKIKFSQSNFIISYFLESLKPFYHNLTHKLIEDSKLFLNKRNKLLKKGDIYTALSRGKNETGSLKIQIDKEILKLKNKHLK